MNDITKFFLVDPQVLGAAHRSLSRAKEERERERERERESAKIPIDALN